MLRVEIAHLIDESPNFWDRRRRSCNAGRNPGCHRTLRKGAWLPRPDELTGWVGTEAGKSKPVRVAMDHENLLADLKERLAYVCRGKGGKK